MADWPLRPFGECGRWLSGGTPRTNVPGYWGGQIPWITSGSLTSFLLSDSERRLTDEGVENGSRLVPRNTVLFVVRGMSLKSEFRVGIATRPMAFGQDCKAVVPAEDVEPLFLANAVRAASRQVLGMVEYAAHGTGRLNTDRMKALPIPLPPLPTQRKIASVLTAYDKLIENNLRRIEIMEELAQRLYREWFVDMRFPGHEDVALLDSPLGPIPVGWELQRLDEVAELHRGRSYRTTNLVDEGGIPFLNLKCIDRDGGFRRNGLKRYEGPLKAHQIAGAGDLIMALTDMTQERRIVARAARVPKLNEPKAAMSMDLLRVEPLNSSDKAFIYGMLRFSQFPDQVKQYANGANVLHLSPDRIAEYAVPMPAPGLRERFSETFEPLLELSDNLEFQNENLSATRALLLPKLLSGEIDVSGLDIGTEWLES